MKIGDEVRLYDRHNKWFHYGTITSVDELSVTVDFMDWIAQYKVEDISKRFIMYEVVLVANGPGTKIKSF